jgi:ABC-type transport system involved in multi-copper enzyme maturation permease subunit
VVPAIAINVFKESVRDKVLYNLVFFAVLLISASYLIGQLTAGQDIKIIKDLGLAATSVFGLFIAVFIGIGLVSKEVEKRSIYSLLTKPIGRKDFIIGKYLGLVLTLLVNVGVMTVALYAVLGYMAWMAGGWWLPAWERPAVDPVLLKAIALIFLQLMIVTAIALFFSTFSTPMLSASLTFGLYVVGHFNADLKNFENVIDSRPAVYTARTLYYLLPNLAPLDVKDQVVHGVPVSWPYMTLNTGYAILYVTALVLGAVFIFSRRDFDSPYFFSASSVFIAMATVEEFVSVLF